jgi:hypothetical protein
MKQTVLVEYNSESILPSGIAIQDGTIDSLAYLLVRFQYHNFHFKAIIFMEMFPLRLRCIFPC